MPPKKNPTSPRPWYLERTVWVGIGALIAGLTGILSGDISLEVGGSEFLGGLGLITGRRAISKLETSQVIALLLVGLILCSGCAALWSFIAGEDGTGETTKDVGEKIAQASISLLPPPFGLIGQIVGWTVSGLGSTAAHLAQKKQRKSPPDPETEPA